MGIALESFLLTITSTLSFLYDSDERIMKIYCFGDLMAHPHIYDRIESFTIASEILELVNSDECFSKGAIIHGLLVEKLKLPAVVENITRNKDEQTKKEYDNPISNKDYDLIIGIGILFIYDNWEIDYLFPFYRFWNNIFWCIVCFTWS